MTRKIAVLMCAHNEERFISKSIESVLDQSFTDFDLLISENHSTDSTLDIVNRYISLDNRVKYLRPDHFCKSMENGRFIVEKANAIDYEVTIQIGAHDLMDRRYVDLLYRAYLDNPTASVIAGRGIEIDVMGNKLRDWPSITQLKGGHVPFRPIATLFTIFYNVASFGLWPQRVRRDVKIRHDCMCGDHLYLAEASLHGDIIVEPEAVIYTRRTDGVGDVPTYFKKHISDDLHLSQILVDYEKQFEWVIHICNTAFSNFPVAQKNIIIAGVLGHYFVMYGVPTLSAIDGALEAWLESPSGLEIASRMNSIGNDVKQNLRIQGATNS